MQVTWWELEELLDHFKDFPSLFEQLSPTMWLRLGSREGEPVLWYGIAVIPPRPHKYGCATLKTSHMDTSHPMDLEWLVLKFTSYNIRLRISEALVEELKCDQRTATLMGIGLSYIALVSPDPSAEQMAESPGLDPLPDSSRVLHTIGGGWTKLSRVGPGLVKATISARAHADTGYGSHLVGFLHPVDNQAGTLDGIFPYREVDDEREDVDKVSQLPLLHSNEERRVTNEPSNLPSDSCVSEVSVRLSDSELSGGKDSSDTGNPS